MLANAVLQFAPITEATFDSLLLLRLSDINIFPSNCDALGWVVEMLNLAQYIGTTRKHAHFTATSFFGAHNGP